MSKLHGLKHWRKFLIQVNERGAHHSNHCYGICLSDKCIDINCDKCPLMVCEGKSLNQVRSEYINHISKEVGL
ncbi:hypothetical protein CPT_P15_013 [Pectobacterium phage vB_PcaP_P15_PC2B6]|uniref:Uncharacterized protein n=1 Tax=Pectobacterium phage vB_PcaP_P15_PC2B6 TaxID=2968434 RepID=A0AAX3BT72_9CAUD|nr:hypothetical protein CPT_P15_013 [Pectobacterium phage vB_PcaP_P15_PC2B6]